MCHALFIAAPVSLPTVPPTNPPVFHVELLRKDYSAVRHHFPAGWEIRYAGSTSGCGCDFHGAGSEESRRALSAYLAVLDPSVPLQLYDCWEGDLDESSESTCTATLEELSASHDVLAERRLVTISFR